MNHGPRDPNNAHNGEQISLVSLSPNGEYIVTYSEINNSIEGWVVETFGLILDPQMNVYNLPERGKNKEKLKDIQINNSKIVCYTDDGINCFKMSDGYRSIKLNPMPTKMWSPTIYFKKNGKLVIFEKEDDKISVYSTQNDELNLMSSYKLSSCNKGVFIDEDNNIWAVSPNYLFHWDSKTLQLEISYSLGFTIDSDSTDKRFTVISKGNLIVVKYLKQIAIFSKGVHFPIRNIQLKFINTRVELCEIQNIDYLLVFTLPKEDKQNIELYSISDINEQPIDVSMIFDDEFILYEYNSESRKAFGLVNGKLSYINLNWHEFFESHRVFFESHRNDNNYVGWENYLCEDKYYNDTLAFPDMENIRSLFENVESLLGNTINGINSIDINFNNQNNKWRIELKDGNLNKLSIYKGETELQQCSAGPDDIYFSNMHQWKILNNNALALRNDYSIRIYEYDNDNNDIKLQYEFSRSDDQLSIEDFSGPILPIMINVFDDTIDYIIKDDRCLARYGPTLLPNLLNPTNDCFDYYIEYIYNKCTKLVKDDPKRNLKFLNIIALSMSDLYKTHPDFVTKFNSEMFMILDPFINDEIKYDKEQSHFYTFSEEIEISKISKFSEFLKPLQTLFSLNLSTLFTFWRGIVTKFTFQSDIVTKKQYINLIIPLNYSHYPVEYSMWKELFYPQPSVFVDTCERNFYTSLNGEAIINFKWNTFGRKYHCAIWLLFSVFLACFTFASYPSNSITHETRIKLYQTSIALGLLHFILFKLRQFFWYSFSIWNIFDLIAYFSAIVASIYWIRYNNIPDWALSISCLLLDLKFLLFLRVFDPFGVYFAIMLGVLEHSLNARNQSDPNNPWTLSNTYNQVGKNGNILKETFVQVPTENTNLFYSYPTSLLATYLFLTGSTNSLSSWAPKSTVENTILFVLMALFSFLIVIYLMNLIIGLLNMSIEKDRASYLAQKAKVIAEIELFCLLPYQRRWRSWFPEVIYYSADIEKARAHIKEAINKGYWQKEDWPEMKYKILKLFNINDAIIDLAV
ncbi:hypothetical protein RclHR1_01360021 [Rhizophagus clarus]|uniref:Ion transport domain-containing protein n=1 Tax=Rhizophagus clarus TaxID=94130 RepID=A0A2Z6QAE4_9GLOM|nr:hypothetical protein RclHR1_01360021 [Rhizophagus clarus]